MCQIIVVNNGDIEIQTVKQFKEYFNVQLDDEDLVDECCLCQLDLPTELSKLGIPFKMDEGGDFNIPLKSSVHIDPK